MKCFIIIYLLINTDMREESRIYTYISLFLSALVLSRSYIGYIENHLNCLKTSRFRIKYIIHCDVEYVFVH